MSSLVFMRWKCIVIPLCAYLFFLLVYIIVDIVGQNGNLTPGTTKDNVGSFAMPVIPEDLGPQDNPIEPYTDYVDDEGDTLFYRPSITDACINMSRPHPNIINAKEKFSMVCPRSSFVYSAFYDRRRKSPVVRIIGIAEILDSCHPEHCVVWYPRRSLPDVMEVKVVQIPESHDKRYSWEISLKKEDKQISIIFDLYLI